jgi:hypothetical protein
MWPIKWASAVTGKQAALGAKPHEAWRCGQADSRGSRLSASVKLTLSNKLQSL